MASVRILGIDPGSQITGFGVVDVVGNRTTAVEWGSIRTGGEHSDRLRSIFTALGQVVREYRPTEIAIERVFLSRNADSALKLGQARAAAICATFEANVPIYEYSARHIKKAVVGSGARREGPSATHGADDSRRSRSDCGGRRRRARGRDLPCERAHAARRAAGGRTGVTR